MEDHIEFDLNKYSSNSSMGFISEVDLQCPNELRKLHNNYFLASDRIEEKCCSNYQLKIPAFCNTPIGNVKKWCHFFLTKKSMCFILKVYNFI